MKPYSIPPEEVRERLGHVRFIGGGSGAGKSTVARQLAARYGLFIYCTDPLSKYVERTTPEDAPLLHTFIAMDMDDRWLHRSPQVMVDTFHGFQGEQFHLIVEDLLALSRDLRVVAEGFSLLPRLVAPLMRSPSQAVWLLPTPEFRRAAFKSRGSIWDIPHKTHDPERALVNLLERDRLFTDRVRREATNLNLRVITVDIGMVVDELVKRVAVSLDLEVSA